MQEIIIEQFVMQGGEDPSLTYSLLNFRYLALSFNNFSNESKLGHKSLFPSLYRKTAVQCFNSGNLSKLKTDSSKKDR